MLYADAGRLQIGNDTTPVVLANATRFHIRSGTANVVYADAGKLQIGGDANPVLYSDATRLHLRSGAANVLFANADTFLIGNGANRVVFADGSKLQIGTDAAPVLYSDATRLHLRQGAANVLYADASRLQIGNDVTPAVLANATRFHIRSGVSNVLYADSSRFQIGGDATPVLYSDTTRLHLRSGDSNVLYADAGRLQIGNDTTPVVLANATRFHIRSGTANVLYADAARFQIGPDVNPVLYSDTTRLHLRSGAANVLYADAGRLQVGPDLNPVLYSDASRLHLRSGAANVLYADASRFQIGGDAAPVLFANGGQIRVRTAAGANVLYADAGQLALGDGATKVFHANATTMYLGNGVRNYFFANTSEVRVTSGTGANVLYADATRLTLGDGNTRAMVIDGNKLQIGPDADPVVFANGGQLTLGAGANRFLIANSDTLLLRRGTANVLYADSSKLMIGNSIIMDIDRLKLSNSVYAGNGVFQLGPNTAPVVYADGTKLTIGEILYVDPTVLHLRSGLSDVLYSDGTRLQFGSNLSPAFFADQSRIQIGGGATPVLLANATRFHIRSGTANVLYADAGRLQIGNDTTPVVLANATRLHIRSGVSNVLYADTAKLQVGSDVTPVLYSDATRLHLRQGAANVLYADAGRLQIGDDATPVLLANTTRFHIRSGAANVLYADATRFQIGNDATPVLYSDVNKLHLRQGLANVLYVDTETFQIGRDAAPVLAANTSTLVLQTIPAPLEWGYGDNVFVSTSAAQPKVRTSGGIGMPFVEFNRSMQHSYSAQGESYQGLLVNSNGGLTIAALVCFRSTSWNETICAFDGVTFRRYQGTDALEVELYETPSGWLAAESYSFQTSGAIVDGEWAMFVARYTLSSGVMELYKDGVLLNSISGVNVINNTNLGPGFRSEIGSNLQNGYFDGDMASVVVYDRSLSDPEMTQMTTFCRTGVGSMPTPEGTFIRVNLHATQLAVPNNVLFANSSTFKVGDGPGPTMFANQERFSVRLPSAPRLVSFYGELVNGAFFNHINKFYDYPALIARYPVGTPWYFTYEMQLYRATFGESETSQLKAMTVEFTLDDGITWSPWISDGTFKVEEGYQNNQFVITDLGTNVLSGNGQALVVGDEFRPTLFADATKFHIQSSNATVMFANADTFQIGNDVTPVLFASPQRFAVRVPSSSRTVTFDAYSTAFSRWNIRKTDDYAALIAMYPQGVRWYFSYLDAVYRFTFGFTSTATAHATTAAKLVGGVWVAASADNFPQGVPITITDLGSNVVSGNGRALVLGNEYDPAMYVDAAQATFGPAGSPYLYVGLNGTNNTFLGANVGTVDGGNVRNTYVGALSGNVGSNNVAVGFEAGKLATGNNNTYVGYATGVTNNGSDNTVVGSLCGARGSYNAMMGLGAGRAMASGDANALVGWKAGGSSTSMTQCVGIGWQSIQNASGAANLVAIGASAGRNSAECRDSVFVGSLLHARGNTSVFVGTDIVVNNAGNTVMIGADISMAGHTSNTATNSVLIGSNITTAVGLNDCIAIGQDIRLGADDNNAVVIATKFGEVIKASQAVTSISGKVGMNLRTTAGVVMSISDNQTRFHSSAVYDASVPSGPGLLVFNTSVDANPGSVSLGTENSGLTMRYTARNEHRFHVPSVVGAAPTETMFKVSTETTDAYNTFRVHAGAATPRVTVDTTLSSNAAVHIHNGKVLRFGADDYGASKIVLWGTGSNTFSHNNFSDVYALGVTAGRFAYQAPLGARHAFFEDGMEVGGFSCGDFGGTRGGKLYLRTGAASPISSTFQLRLSTDSASKPTSTTWTVSSDERVKADIESADLDLCTRAVKSIPLRRFRWQGEVADATSDKRVLGWIAQEVKQVLPKSVVITEAYGIADFHHLNADQIYAVMYGCLQKAVGDIESHEATIRDLQSTVAGLVARVTALEM